MKMKLLVVVLAIVSVLSTINVANAGEGDVVFGAATVAAVHKAAAPSQFTHTILPIAILAPIVYAVLTDGSQPCDDLPIKYIKQTGANYLTSVSGCEAKYPG